MRGMININESCVECKKPLGRLWKNNVERIGLYFAVDSLTTIQKYISWHYDVEEGYICCNCWIKLKAEDKFKLLLAFFSPPFGKQY